MDPLYFLIRLAPREQHKRVFQNIYTVYVKPVGGASKWNSFNDLTEIIKRNIKTVTVLFYWISE